MINADTKPIAAKSFIIVLSLIMGLSKLQPPSQQSVAAEMLGRNRDHFATAIRRKYNVTISELALRRRCILLSGRAPRPAAAPISGYSS